MMNEYATEAFMPQISVVLCATVVAIMIVAFTRGFFYKAPKNATLEGLLGFGEFIVAVALVDVVFMSEHYDGLVQTIINFLQHNTDTSAAWADIIAILGISILGAAVGAGYITVRRIGYRCHKRNLRRLATEKM